MAHDITREQESAIARLAIDHPSVAVTPQEDGTVKVETGGKRYLLDENGNYVSEPVERAYVPLPVALLRRMLGDEVIDAALEAVVAGPYPEHALATRLGDQVPARIGELLRDARTRGVTAEMVEQ